MANVDTTTTTPVTNTNYVGATTGAVAPQHGLRRRHNFGDRVYKLTPEETPFFVYLSRVAKMPTDDPVFRVLEDREQMKWTDRTFNLAMDNGDEIVIDKDAGVAWSYTASGGAASANVPVNSSAELIAGMVFVLNSPATGGLPRQILCRCDEVVSATTVKVSNISSGDDTITITAGSDTDSDFGCQVVGTSFEEGGRSPDSFVYGIDDTWGYTQIFKTSATLTNTARATVMRGYASEWDRIWAMKLREHKVDIERALLFSNKAMANGIQHSDGIIGNILKNATFVDDDSKLEYASKTSFARNIDLAPAGGGASEFTWDRFLEDLEVYFAPERGGSSEKLCMASIPILTQFNKMSGGFMDNSVSSPFHLNLNAENRQGAFGHKIMTIETIHGTLHLVKQPLFKGASSHMMVAVDLDCLKYRPLVGNGVNRDTYIETNVQLPDEDLRKDMILTEAGLEVCLPETHAIWNFNSGGVAL